MKLLDLKKYCFHDSSILEISQIGNNIILKIEFCLFMQDNYVDGTDENCLLELTFYEASSNTSNIESNTIIDTKIDSNKVIFNLNLDKNDDYMQLEINASSVEITIK